MNKEELLQQQAKLQAEMDKLKELIEKTPDSTRPRAENEGIYYYIDDQSRVVRTLDWYEEWDNNRHRIRNYYLSKEECEYIAACKLTKQKLKDLAFELNKGKAIDWTNTWSNKYCIYYNYDSKDLKQYHNQFSKNNKNQGQIYCYDENFLNIAKQKIGEDKLIQLITKGI